MSLEAFNSDSNNSPDGPTDARVHQPEEFQRVKEIEEKSLYSVCECCNTAYPDSKLQNHHLCYFPEVTVTVCQECHTDIHHSNKYPELKPINKRPRQVQLPASLFNDMEDEVEWSGEMWEVYEIAGHGTKKAFVAQAVKNEIKRIKEQYND